MSKILLGLQHFLIMNMYYKGNQATASITALLTPLIITSICFTLIAIVLFCQPILIERVSKNREKKRPMVNLKEDYEEEKVGKGPEMKTRNIIRYSSLIFWISFTFFVFFFASYLNKKRDPKNDPGNLVSSIFLAICLICGIFYLIAIVFMHQNFKYM